MKFKLLVSVLVFNFIGLVPISCKNKDCDSAACECGNVGSYTYHVEEMKFLAVDTRTTIDLDTSEYVSLAQFYLVAQVTQLSEQTSYKTPRVESLMPTAMACSPVADKAGQQISNIEFIAMNSVQYNPEVSIDSLDNINSMLMIQRGHQQGFSSLVNFLTETKDMDMYELRFKLVSAPNADVTLKYRVKISLSDGKVFEFENLQLKIRP